MEWEQLGPGWQAIQAKLKEPGRVLVVDDEEVVRDLLTEILTSGPFVVETARSAEEALERIRLEPFDALITDKNLPGHDGIELIEQIRSEGFDMPAVLVTGFPSVETISRALARGASDYIAKPFDDVSHLRKRIELVVEQRRAAALFDRVVHDLKSVAAAGGSGAAAVTKIERELASYRRRLAGRPDVLLVDGDTRVAGLTVLFLKGGGLSVMEAADATAARAALKSFGPMSVLLSLEVPGAPDLLKEMHAADPELEILVNGRLSHLDEAIAAVAAGASDFVLGASEGLDLLSARVKRAVARSRRRRLYHELMAVLARNAAERGFRVSEVLGSLTSSLDLGLRADVAARAASGEPGIDGAEPRDEEIELADLFIDDKGLEVDWGAQVGPMEASSPVVGSGIAEESYTSLEEQVEFGLEAVSTDRRVEILVRDLLYVCASLEEFLRFFHQPENFPTLESVKEFLGQGDKGALKVLIHAYYDLLRPRLPEDVRRDLDRGRFDHPRRPFYVNSLR